MLQTRRANLRSHLILSPAASVLGLLLATACADRVVPPTAVAEAPREPAAQPNPQVDWLDLGLAWQRYEENPDTTNALGVIERLPSARVPVNPDDRNEALVRGELSGSVQRADGGPLGRQVRAGDPGALRLAFRLLVLADGAYAESLQEILGSVITDDPSLFLRELMQQADVVPTPPLGILLGLGPDFVDRADAARAEIEARIAALSSVREPALWSARDACIEALRGEVDAGPGSPAQAEAEGRPCILATIASYRPNAMNEDYADGAFASYDAVTLDITAPARLAGRQLVLYAPAPVPDAAPWRSVGQAIRFSLLVPLPGNDEFVFTGAAQAVDRCPEEVP